MLNEQVTAFIDQAPAEQKQIMEAIRGLIHESVKDVEEQYKWSRPVFRAGKDFAYLKPTKTYVSLGFFHFDKLDDPNGLLEGTGKDMRHIKIKKLKDLDNKLLKSWFKQSAKNG